MGLCLHLHDEPVPAIPGASADATTANLHAALRTSVPRFPHVWIRAEEASGTRRLRCPPVLLQPIRSSPQARLLPSTLLPTRNDVQENERLKMLPPRNPKLPPPRNPRRPRNPQHQQPSSQPPKLP